MSKGRILLLVLMALAMVIAAIATWGSIGSVTLVFCLILMGLSLLWQRCMINRDDYDDYQPDV